MGELCEVKEHLDSLPLLELLSLCHWPPTAQAMRRLAAAYKADPAVCAFGWMEEGEPCGLIVLQVGRERTAIIRGLAVDEEHRKDGIGRCLVDGAAERLDLHRVSAETDGGAVGFYMRCGFTVRDLGEKYPGVRRYECTRVIPPHPQRRFGGGAPI